MNGKDILILIFVLLFFCSLILFPIISILLIWGSDPDFMMKVLATNVIVLLTSGVIANAAIN